MTSIRIDLHTHSVASPDGGLTLAQYKRMLEQGDLDVIAITDHNRIDFAMQAHNELGDKIIVGEEIITPSGEIIGLFLNELVPPGLPLQETVALIKAQGCVVYAPHPFETLRSGLSVGALESIAPFVDIVETKNGRAIFQDRYALAEQWAQANNLPGAASSDSHGWHGWGKTYSIIARVPAKDTLAELLETAEYVIGNPGLRGMLYPKFNRLRRRQE